MENIRSQISTTNVKGNKNTSVIGVKLIKQTYKKMDFWHEGYTYDEKKVTNYLPKKLKVSEVQKRAILRNFRYVRLGAINVVYGLTPEKNSLSSPDKMLDSLLVQEIYEMNNRMYLCLYTAVLLNVLLSREPSLDKRKLRYVQGFIKTIPSENYRTPDGNQISLMYTVHAFNTYDGAVLDTNVSQVEKYRDHELKQDYVIGDSGAEPEIFSHHGFIEYPGTVMRYIKQFALKSGMSPDEWINHHHRNALIMDN